MILNHGKVWAPLILPESKPKIGTKTEVRGLCVSGREMPIKRKLVHRLRKAARIEYTKRFKSVTR